jgi:coenzyme F420-reducing hydrogenase delta subunit
MHVFTDELIMNQLKTATASWSTALSPPHILVFICTWSYKQDAMDLKWPKNSAVVPVKCSGRIDPLHVLRGFMLGADGVLVVSCGVDNCHYIFGGSAAMKHFKDVKAWLQTTGINSERLKFEQSLPGKEQDLQTSIWSFSHKLEKLGPSSLKVLHH